MAFFQISGAKIRIFLIFIDNFWWFQIIFVFLQKISYMNTQVFEKSASSNGVKIK